MANKTIIILKSKMNFETKKYLRIEELCNT